MREVCSLLDKQSNFQHIGLFLNVSQKHFTYVPTTQKVKDVITWNFGHIIFRWRQRFRQILKSALVVVLVVLRVSKLYWNPDKYAEQKLKTIWIDLFLRDDVNEIAVWLRLIKIRQIYFH